MANLQRTTCFTLIASAMLIAMGAPKVAGAHGVFLHVRVEGEVIRGKAEYVGSGAIADAAITVYTPSGRRLGGTKTNDQGEFTFTPREVVDHRFWLNADSGHGAEQVVEAADLPGSLLAASGDVSPSSDEPPVARTADSDIVRQIGTLTEEVARLRRSIRFHDIVGGIGYIVGLTGLWFYFKARRPKNN